MRFVLIIFLVAMSLYLHGAVPPKVQRWTIKSPDGTIEVKLVFEKAAGLQYAVQRKGKAVLEESSLGLVFDKVDFSGNYNVISVSKLIAVSDKYAMIQGKRSSITYQANEQIFHLEKDGNKVAVQFRVSNDGAAFRYDLTSVGNSNKVILSESSTFDFPVTAKGFLQPMSVAKTGWSRVNPCYEENYEIGVPVSTPSSLKQGWVYPALFEVGSNWALITETGLDENYCGTHLSDASKDGEFQIAFPQKDEASPGGGLNPVVSTFSPWRVIVVGDLSTIIESTLGTDLAAPAANPSSYSWVKPGHASWSWALLKDDSTVFSVQRKFIDYAADMGWEYCLIDAAWDKMIGYEKMKELSTYATQKNVGLILWYNSAGDWNDTPYTPKNVMLTHESRELEFRMLKKAGVRGMKIDFFGGDGQSVIKYYLDILKDAAAHNLLVNFHGSTIPRGWHRTYPNLINTEAVKGFEYVTFEQVNADLQPSHCAILPFTRNVFDPMDFTPMSLYKIPRIERRTTSAFELALPVVFLAGVHHMVEIPSGMAHVPDFVKQFLRELPVSWDESKFIAGYPGKEFVIARRSGDKWFVAGINGQTVGTALKLDLSFIGGDRKGYIIQEGSDALSFERKEFLSTDGNAEVKIPAAGGFVLVIETKN